MAPGKRAQYKQAYRKEWETDDKLKAWISPCHGNSTRAMCKYCKCEVRAHHNDLLDHAKTQKHIRATSLHESLPVGQQKIDSVFKSTGSKVQDVNSTKVAELKLATHLAIHSPLSLADHLVCVCKSAFPDSATALRVKMGATKCTALVTRVLGPTFSEKLICDMKNRKFSILVDESTDCGNMKHLCIIVRYFSERQQCIITKYLGLIRIEDASANGLYTAVKEFFKTKGIQEENCIRFASDGASVMAGKNNSLYSKLRHDIPHLRLVQCMCHSLHLACSKAVEALPKQLDFIIKETHNWFSCSPKRRDTYAVLYQTINDESPLQIPGLADTRWLSRCKLFLVEAVREVIKRVPASGDHLEVLNLLAPTDDTEISFTKLLPEIKRLTKCSIGILENQWRARKYLAIPQAVISDTVKYWIYLLNYKDCAGNRQFEELAAAALCLLSLPISNAECERVFSQVKLLKNDLRTRLSTDTLDSLLHIRFNVRGDTRNAEDCCGSFNPDNDMLKKFTSDMYH
ncbi:hypothetical protein Pcinc_029875 [Petrolisthes cinctipes]|uniref:DUF4371 domain-containing protein n=1 Tax=Petrolisthes cinctipes TaxID=88211 RepID=A0AAE1K538_PETCI|nr:hypothetical protein Pcinc_029875 [Petrolisthes cinctipes]